MPRSPFPKWIKPGALFVCKIDKDSILITEVEPGRIRYTLFSNDAIVPGLYLNKNELAALCRTDLWACLHPAPNRVRHSLCMPTGGVI